MIRGLTHVVSIKGLSFLSCVAVGSGVQVFHVENDIFGWAFRRKEGTSQNGNSNVSLHRGRKY